MSRLDVRIVSRKVIRPIITPSWQTGYYIRVDIIKVGWDLQQKRQNPLPLPLAFKIQPTPLRVTHWPNTIQDFLDIIVKADIYLSLTILSGLGGRPQALLGMLAKKAGG